MPESQLVKPATFRNAMGCGASSEEITDGSAVTGAWGKKVMMPDGVAGEAIAGGMKPGSKLTGFTPAVRRDENSA